MRENVHVEYHLAAVSDNRCAIRTLQFSQTTQTDISVHEAQRVPSQFTGHSVNIARIPIVDFFLVKITGCFRRQSRVTCYSEFVLNCIKSLPSTIIF